MDYRSNLPKKHCQVCKKPLDIKTISHGVYFFNKGLAIGAFKKARTCGNPTCQRQYLINLKRQTNRENIKKKSCLICSNPLSIGNRLTCSKVCSDKLSVLRGKARRVGKRDFIKRGPKQWVLKDKICIICKSQFKGNAPSRYCSLECREIGTKKNTIACRIKNKEKHSILCKKCGLNKVYTKKNKTGLCRLCALNFSVTHKSIKYWLSEYELIYQYKQNPVSKQITRLGRVVKKGTKPARLNPLNQNYPYILIDNKAFKEHHISWVLAHKKYPKKNMVIHHIDHWRINSDPENLKEVSFKENTKQANIFYKTHTGYKYIYRLNVQKECLNCGEKFYPRSSRQKICLKPECQNNRDMAIYHYRMQNDPEYRAKQKADQAKRRERMRLNKLKCKAPSPIAIL